jgi:uncharacterized membrane protein (UPF0127 family)
MQSCSQSEDCAKRVTVHMQSHRVAARESAGLIKSEINRRAVLRATDELAATGGDLFVVSSERAAACVMHLCMLPMDLRFIAWVFEVGVGPFERARVREPFGIAPNCGTEDSRASLLKRRERSSSGAPRLLVAFRGCACGGSASREPHANLAIHTPPHAFRLNIPTCNSDACGPLCDHDHDARMLAGFVRVHPPRH